MTKKSDAPAIRFKGFSDAWEQRKLSEITDKVTEKNAGPVKIYAQNCLQAPAE